MKKSMLVVATLVLTSCADQLVMEEVAGEMNVSNSASEITTLMEKAKWGDGEAYLKLADCYRDGKGVKKDFVEMLGMAALAEAYDGINNFEDYLETMPEDSEFKLMVDVIALSRKNQVEEMKAKTDQLFAMGSSEGYTMQGVMAVDRGDTLEGLRLMESAALQGSSFAELLLCTPNLFGTHAPNVERLKALEDSMPLACQFLADVYSGSWDWNMRNDSLVAHYYLKADEKAYLGKQGARWLLNYHRNKDDFNLSEQDFQRFQFLAGETMSGGGSSVDKDDADGICDEVDDTAVVADTVVVE